MPLVVESRTTGAPSIGWSKWRTDAIHVVSVRPKSFVLSMEDAGCVRQPVAPGTQGPSVQHGARVPRISLPIGSAGADPSSSTMPADQDVSRASAESSKQSNLSIPVSSGSLGGTHPPTQAYGASTPGWVPPATPAMPSEAPDYFSNTASKPKMESHPWAAVFAERDKQEPMKAGNALHFVPPTPITRPRSSSPSGTSGVRPPGGARLPGGVPISALGALAGAPRRRTTMAATEPLMASGRITATTPAELCHLLEKQALGGSHAPTHLLMVDIRPPTAFSQSHIVSSINLCAPSTLLKRPEFTADRLAEQMLDPGPERNVFQQWHEFTSAEAPHSWIVAIDADSTSLTSTGRSHTGGGGPCLVGLLSKFDKGGFKGRLRWLCGGYQAFNALSEAEKHLTRSPLPGSTGRGSGLPSNSGIVRPRGLTLDAFRRTSTVDGGSGDASDQQAVNPFFDNIRQNMELSCGITDVVPLDVDASPAQHAKLPVFLCHLLDMSPNERGRLLASRFFDIEKQEQQRMHSVLQRHTYESFNKPGASELGRVSSRAANPYSPTERQVSNEAFLLSISAALERGQDHRYRNFWTFEHSRVQLKRPLKDGDPSTKYINASFVNPLRYLGQHRVYVATQAPLPDTMPAFWGVVWEQRIEMILMLSREYEGGRLQCHNYWEAPTSSPFVVELCETAPLTRGELGLSGSNATVQVAVRRTLRVSDSREPTLPPHHVTQLQFVDWPDHSVPDSADELLALMQYVKKHEAQAGMSASPVLVHCSAGIGRTGTYIAIDTLSSYLCLVRDVCEGRATDPCMTREQAEKFWNSDIDLVFEAVVIMREQRMSLIQTVRQYVFVYRALIEFLLAQNA